jgi:hypothetical protein
MFPVCRALYHRFRRVSKAQKRALRQSVRDFAEQIVALYQEGHIPTLRAL